MITISFTEKSNKEEMRGNECMRALWRPAISVDAQVRKASSRSIVQYKVVTMIFSGSVISKSRWCRMSQPRFLLMFISSEHFIDTKQNSVVLQQAQ